MITIKEAEEIHELLINITRGADRYHQPKYSLSGAGLVAKEMRVSQTCDFSSLMFAE